MKICIEPTRLDIKFSAKHDQLQHRSIFIYLVDNNIQPLISFFLMRRNAESAHSALFENVVISVFVYGVPMACMKISLKQLFRNDIMDGGICVICGNNETS